MGPRCTSSCGPDRSHRRLGWAAGAPGSLVGRSDRRPPEGTMARPRVLRRPRWMHADRPVARAVSQPVVRFLQIEAAGGILLLAATAAALVWANSPWSAGYHHLWAREVSLEVGPLHLAEDLEHWVNDALMALFFFVVGLEIKR